MHASGLIQCRESLKHHVTTVTQETMISWPRQNTNSHNMCCWHPTSSLHSHSLHDLHNFMLYFAAACCCQVWWNMMKPSRFSAMDRIKPMKSLMLFDAFWCFSAYFRLIHIILTSKRSNPCIFSGSDVPSALAPSSRARPARTSSSKSPDCREWQMIASIYVYC